MKLNILPQVSSLMILGITLMTVMIIGQEFEKCWNWSKYISWLSDMTCRWLADALQMTCRRLEEMTCKWLANELQINDLHNRTWICLANCVLWLANMTYKHCRISHTHGHGFLKSCFSFLYRFWSCFSVTYSAWRALLPKPTPNFPYF